MPVNYGDDVEYARSRINGTMVFIGGMPHFVDTIYDNGMTAVKNMMASDDYYEVHMKELDLTPPELGFFDEKQGVGYLTRLPMRQWKQGFRTAQATLVIGSRKPDLMSQSFVKMVMGMYDTIHTCIEKVSNEERYSCAFDREFCIIRDKKKDSDEVGVSFRNKVFATLPRKFQENIQPKFMDGMDYMAELFEESLGGHYAK